MTIFLVYMVIVTGVVVGQASTVKLKNTTSMNDGGNVTLVCNTNGKDLTFTFTSKSSDSSVPIAECVVVIQHCFLMNSTHRGTYAIRHADNGGSLTILSLNKALYGTYACLETYDTTQKASVEIDFKTDEHSQNARGEIPYANPNDADVGVSNTTSIGAIICGVLIPIVALVVLILIGWRRGWLKHFTFLHQKDRERAYTNDHKKHSDEDKQFINKGSLENTTNDGAETRTHFRADHNGSDEDMKSFIPHDSETIATDVEKETEYTLNASHTQTTEEAGHDYDSSYVSANAPDMTN